MVGWNRSKALQKIIAGAAGIGCEKLEQVGSLFCSMTKKGKKDVDRNNCTLEMTEYIEI
jgi:hypothetical protein